MWGIYRDNDEWVDTFGAGERCPKCGAPDWHPDPSGPNGEEWEVCEHCGYEVDTATGKPPEFEKRNVEWIDTESGGDWYPILMPNPKDPRLWSFEETIKAGAERPIRRPEQYMGDMYYCECCGDFKFSVRRLPFDNPEFPDLPDKYVCDECFSWHYGLSWDCSTRPAKIVKGEYFEKHRKNGWKLL